MSDPADLKSVAPSLAEEPNPLDLHAYWRTLVRRRWTVLGVFAGAVLLTALFMFRQPKIYAGTTTLIIDHSAPRVLNAKDVQDVVETGSGGYWYSREYYETQYKVITSRAVAKRVVEKLALAGDERFLGGDANLPSRVAAAKLDAAALLQQRLTVQPVKDSRVVRVRVEDRDPVWAATLANEVADAYIAESLSVRSTTTRTASEWLEEQVADLEGKVSKSADELFRFKQAHDIVSTSWEDRQSIVTQRLVAINEALTKARVQSSLLLARNEQLAKAVHALKLDPQSAEGAMLLTQNAAIQQLRVRYLDARVECADLATRYLDDHPKAEACAAKVAAAKQNLDREVEGTLAAAVREHSESADAERRLQALLGETKNDAFALNQYEKEYSELRRSHENYQRLYDMVLQRLKETGVTGMLQMSNVRILDRAQPVLTPVRPNVRRNIALAAVLGLLGGMAVALLIDSLDRTVATPQQVEERLGLTFLGLVPSVGSAENDRAPELVVHTRPNSAPAECLRALRTNLLFMGHEKPLRTLLVTSAQPREGKTMTAASLAVTMAANGSRVLLVDTDMRRPRLHKVFGVDSETGLSSLMLGQGSVATEARRTGIENLSLLPCGPVPPNPAELLHSEAFPRLLRELSAAFDRVIIDSPPVGVVADAAVVGAAVDGALVVLKAGKTTREAARRAVRQLRDVNTRIVGAVLNEVDLAHATYGVEYYGYGEYSAEARGGRGGEPPAAA